MSFGGVYVAATRQHVGKTSSSLGLVAGLQRIFTGKGVGFIKPMGQSHVEHVNDDGSKVLIDKDCPLFSDLLGCRGTPTDMSPLVVPRGTTSGDMSVGVPRQPSRSLKSGQSLSMSTLEPSSLTCSTWDWPMGLMKPTPFPVKMRCRPATRPRELLVLPTCCRVAAT